MRTKAAPTSDRGSGGRFSGNARPWTYRSLPLDREPVADLALALAPHVLGQVLHVLVVRQLARGVVEAPGVERRARQM